jgi:hypothetical protein
MNRMPDCAAGTDTLLVGFCQVATPFNQRHEHGSGDEETQHEGTGRHGTDELVTVLISCH